MRINIFLRLYSKNIIITDVTQNGRVIAKSPPCLPDIFAG